MGIENMSDSKYLALAVSQAQSNMGQTNMPDLKNLSLAVSYTQGNMGSQPSLI